MERNDNSGSLQIPQKLYGRKRELDTLYSIFTQVCSTNSAVVLVSGHTGIGKTTLVEEVRKSLRRETAYCITGVFDQFQRNIPYHAVMNAFSDFIRQILSESGEDVVQWRNLFLSALGSNAQVIIDVLPELALIVGRQPPVPALEPEQVKNRFNHLFQRFIGVLTDTDHVLVLFLDDLHWADTASIELLNNIVSEQKKNLLLIGAYRDDEIHASHPAQSFIDELDKTENNFHTINLLPLQQQSISRLIAETFHCGSEAALPLAEMIEDRSGGNPLFIQELIRSLYDEQLIYFDQHEGEWNWSLPEISKKDIAENVFALMTGRMQNLSETARHNLQLASCMGNCFDLEILTCLAQQEQEEVTTLLHEAVAENMVAYQVISGRQRTTVEYRFCDDRIRQAIYALIPEKERQSIHQRIGLILQDRIGTENREEIIFTVVNQLNLGVDLVTDKDRRHQLAGLNFVAGKKAKTSAAYEPAFAYFKTGVSLLEEESWHTHYELSLHLWTQAAEAACLCRDFEQLDRYADKVSNKAKTVLDSLRVNEMKIMAYFAQNKLQDALNTAITVLNDLGITLPTKPNKLHIIKELVKFKTEMAGKDIEALMYLPQMTDPYKIAAMGILIRVGTAAYMSGSMLAPIMIFKRVMLSLKFGNTPLSAIAYASMGIVCCGKLGDIKTGYMFGNFSLQMLNNAGMEEHKSRIYLIHNAFVRHWKEHLKASLEPLDAGYRAGLNTGDFEYASLCGFVYCWYSFFVGNELGALHQKTSVRIKEMGGLKQKTSTLVNQLLLQVIAHLMNPSADPCGMPDNYFSEDIFTEFHTSDNKFGLFLLYLANTQLSYMFGNYRRAYEDSLAGEKYADGALGTASFGIAHFYDSLTCLALFTSAEKSEKKVFLKKVHSNQKKMRQWAKHAPMNYLHKWTLVEAEQAGLMKKYDTAVLLYDQAIAQADEHGYKNDKALSMELAGKFYLNNKEHATAKLFFLDAQKAYQRWGAIAKAKHIAQYLNKKDRIEPAKQFRVTQDVDRVSHYAVTFPLTSRQAIPSIQEVSSILKKEMSKG